MKLSEQRWWTPADQAEQELLLHELVRAVSEHQAGCERCRAGFPPCENVAAGVAVLLEWRDRRILRSLAVALRAREELREAEALAA